MAICIKLDLFPQGGKHFFTAIKEGDELKFATDDENERHLWVQALYRATGQAYKPVPPKQSAALQNKNQGFTDKTNKHGLDEFIQADSVINHDRLFMRLQSLTLEYRLNEQICSLGWFSPGQVRIVSKILDHTRLRCSSLMNTVLGIWFVDAIVMFLF